MRVHHHRRQYGVGQGGFHVQTLCVEGREGKRSDQFRIVYDCGVRTKEAGPKAIEWAIDHTTHISRTSKLNRVPVHLLFLSHYDADHISHIELLARKTEVRRVVLPHINREQAFLLCVQALLEKGSISPRYVEALYAVADGGDFLGIPTTRVSGDGDENGIQRDQPIEDSPDETFNGLLDDREFATPPIDAITSRGRLDKRLNHGDDIFLESTLVSKTLTPHVVTLNLWRLRTWVYEGNRALCDDICKDIRSAFAGQALLKLLDGGAIRGLDKVLANFKSHKVGIQKIYTANLRKHKVGSASNHNVVSLCLLSNQSNEGPYRLLHKKFNAAMVPWAWIFPDERNGWLGTGDALLGEESIRNQFVNHFKAHLPTVSTLLAPHHGSGAAAYLSPPLLSMIPIVVFSAGATNQYFHPNLETIEATLEATRHCIFVNEFNRPGYFEYFGFGIGVVE